MNQEEADKKIPIGNRADHSRLESNGSVLREIETTKNARETIGYLQENLEVLEILFSNTHFHLAFLDTDFNFIRVNQAYAEGAGHSPDFFFGKNHFVLFPDKENEAIFRQAVESGESYTVFEKPFESLAQPNRGLTYWDWSIHPVRGINNEVIGLILSLVDVTRRRRAEEAIKVRDKRYQDLLEHSLDGFVRMDMQGFIIESNPAFRNMLGYTEDELKSVSQTDITPVSWLKREELILKNIFETGYTPIYEKEYVSKEGNVVPVELRVYLTRGDKENPNEMWAFIRDITEKKEIEEELRGYVDRLEQSNQELTEFAYVASHDLQEPLRKIQAFGDRLLNKYAEALGETGRDYLERMVGAARRMRELIEALLSYSRVSSQRRHFIGVDLKAALNEAISNLETRIEETGAVLEVMELPALEADPVQMVQLFQNLIGNALKFRRRNTPLIIKIGYRPQSARKRARRKMARKPEGYEMYVQDNGIGFEKKYSDQIFMPLQRLHGRSEYEGVGMGLAICRRIIERHGGSIKVDSQPGQGTTFFFTLPASRETK